MNIKKLAFRQLFWIFALLVLQVDLRAALYLELPGGLGVTGITLQPSQSGQVVDISIRNDSTPLANIYGLNFMAQVGDGASGPKITDVKLNYGDSIFKSFISIDQGSSSWQVFYGISVYPSPTVSIPSGSTLLARLTFDTTGLSGSGPWPIVFNNILGESTKYVLGDLDNTPLAIDNFVSGQIITAVPEPASFALATGLLLLSLGVVRRVKSYSTTRTTPLV